MEDAAQLREENHRLKRAVEELSILNDLACTIGALNNSEEVVRKILGRAMRAVNGEQGVITIVDEHPDLPAKTLIRTSVSSSEHEQFHLHQALMGWMILNKKPLTMNSLQDDERFREMARDGLIRSVICVPMLIRSSLKGVLAVYNKRRDEAFTEDDQRLLGIIASQSAQVVENARLYEEERALIQVRHEMKLASQIQMDLLPKEAPHVPGYDIAGATFPALAVGGDYFDFIPISGDKIAICIGDVAGKGLPAALLAANLQATLHGEANPQSSVAECVRRLNCRLFRSTGPEKFATLFYAVLDHRRHLLTYCNAAHEPPILIDRNSVSERLHEGGSLIGISDAIEVSDRTVPMAVGDIMVAFSDGVTEAMNDGREQFGDEKLLAVLENNLELPAARLIENVVSAVMDHRGKAAQHDDITVLAVRRIAA